jgi:hypothetical protein
MGFVRHCLHSLLRKRNIKRVILKLASWLSDLKLEVDATNLSNGSLERDHAVRRMTAVQIALLDYDATGQAHYVQPS